MRRLAGFIAAFLLSSPVLAADVADGRKLAQTWCSGCHVIDTGQRKAGVDAVPSFPFIANKTRTTKPSLAAFLATRHGGMPDFHLSRAEIRKISAYILSLRKRNDEPGRAPLRIP